MGRKSILDLVLPTIGAGLLATCQLQALEVHTVRLTRPMVVAGVYLRAAAYDVRWEQHDTHATVPFSRKGRAVATVQGEVATLNKTSSKDTLYFSKHPDGFFLINALGFANTNKGIVFSTFRSRSNGANRNPTTNEPIKNDWLFRTRTLPPVYR
jgi:hypothetical protein